MKLIPLSQDLFAKVDDEDYEELSSHKWYAMTIKKTGHTYAVRTDCSIPGRSNQRKVFMHREILGLKYGDRRMGDHREPSETLNNQRFNLRICSRGQNKSNSRVSKHNKTGFKGVHFEPKRNRYSAWITIAGKSKFLGHRKTAEGANGLYRDAAIKNFGEFARSR